MQPVGEYQDALSQAGTEALAESFSVVDEFTAQMSNQGLEYKKDYDVGNIAHVRSEVGPDTDLLIAEISETYQDGKRDLSAVLSPMTVEQDEEESDASLSI